MSGNFLNYQCKCGLDIESSPGYMDGDELINRIWVYDPIIKKAEQLDEKEALARGLVELFDPYIARFWLYGSASYDDDTPVEFTTVHEQKRKAFHCAEMDRTFKQSADPEQCPMICPECGEKSMICYKTGNWD